MLCSDSNAPGSERTWKLVYAPQFPLRVVPGLLEPCSRKGHPDAAGVSSADVGEAVTCVRMLRIAGGARRAAARCMACADVDADLDGVHLVLRAERMVAVSVSDYCSDDSCLRYTLGQSLRSAGMLCAPMYI